MNRFSVVPGRRHTAVLAPAHIAAAARLAAVTMATAGVVLSLAACGGSQPTNGSSSTGTVTSASSQALAFTRCMRSHGVSRYPDPTSANSGPGTQGLPKVNLQALGVSSSKVATAERACQGRLPTSAQLTRNSTRQILSRLVAFARCMRSGGVSNWPDPVHTLGSFPGSPPYGFDLQGLSGLEAGASGSFGPRISSVVGHCLHREHLASSQAPWGSWQR